MQTKLGRNLKPGERFIVHDATGPRSLVVILEALGPATKERGIFSGQTRYRVPVGCAQAERPWLFAGTAWYFYSDDRVKIVQG